MADHLCTTRSTSAEHRVRLLILTVQKVSGAGFDRNTRGCPRHLRDAPRIPGEKGLARGGQTWPGRLSPSFAIRVSSVVGFNPSLSAAPAAPRIRQPVASSTVRM